MTLTDADARRDIREKVGDTLFVDAGAGSGKTTELVERVVTSVLIDGVPLAHTAVVTFTEKAEQNSGTGFAPNSRSGTAGGGRLAPDGPNRAR